MSKKRESTTVRISLDLKAKIAASAAAMNISQAELITTACENYLTGDSHWIRVFRNLNNLATKIENYERRMRVTNEALYEFIKYFFFFAPDVDPSDNAACAQRAMTLTKKYMTRLQENLKKGGLLIEELGDEGK